MCKLCVGRDREADIGILMLDDKSHWGLTMSAVFFLLLTTFEKDSRHAWILFEANISSDHHLGQTANVGLR